MTPQAKYSKKQVERAGNKLRSDSLISDKAEFSKVMEVLSYWRFSHEEPLERAFDILQEEVGKVERHPIYGKRLKRQNSISVKLRRFEKMNLRNMQDVGGCRAVVSSEKKIRKIAKVLKKRPEFKASGGGYRTKDYIKNPKPDGYRSYHIVGQFVGQAGDKKLIEIQLRTYIQHYWATAVEIVDTFTKQALKSNQGEKVWADFFSEVSKMFALMEGMPVFSSLSPQERWTEFSKVLSKEKSAVSMCKNLKKTLNRLGVINKLEAYANSLQIMNQQIEDQSINGYIIIVVTIKDNEGEVVSHIYAPDKASDAEREYIKQEKKYASKDNVVVAMVSTSSMGEIKKAYPNYFADSTYFIALLHLIRIAHV